MALWIQNVTPYGRFGEPVHLYKVAVNNEEPLAFFEHSRADGAAACLRAAADAIDQALSSVPPASVEQPVTSGEGET